jgi:hypothetical protein
MSPGQLAVSDGRLTTVTHPALAVWLMTLIMGTGAQSASALDTPEVVQVELAAPDGQSFRAGTDVVYRLESDTPIDMTVRVFDSDDPSVPIDIADSSALIEIRDVSGGHAALRLANMRHVATGVYATSYNFPTTGEWEIVVQPDVTDRSRLPSDGVDQIRIRTLAPSIEGLADRFDLTLVWALLSLLVLVVALYMTARRWSARDSGRVGRPTVPDTWWNSP